MGKDWDKSHPDPITWQHCWRVLKPGGYLLSFGGTRTWHRLACDIEDAGFEIRDSVAWLYGSGFPKSLDVSKAIDKAAGVDFDEQPASGVGFMRPDGRNGYNVTKNRLTRKGESTDAAQQWQGWGTALKPAFEPIIVARKPLRGTVADNVQRYDTGALNIDRCRVGTTGGGGNCPGGDDCQCKGKNEICAATKHPVRRNGDVGRWPTNVVLDDTQAAELDAQTAELKQGGAIAKGSKGAGPRANTVFGTDNRERGEWQPYGDSGGASRFFPTFHYQAKAPNTQRPNRYGVAHPTVKPLDLMRWLVRLVTPPGGLVLDPFAGSGTTAEACIDEDMRAVLIEIGEDYLPHIVQRIERANTAARQRKRREQRKKRGMT